MTDRSPFEGAGAFGSGNLVIRFLLELAMLAALAIWGFRVADPLWLSIALGIGAPVVVAVVWGAFAAPRAPMRLADPARLTLEIVLFGIAAASLAAVGLPVWAIVLAVAAALNIAILQALRLR